jgi:hypothetical protein
MAIPFAQLLIEWALRRVQLRRLASEDVAGPGWIYAIRVRILSFLLARYGETPVERPRPSERRRARPEPPPRTYCIVKEPRYNPPRATGQLTAIMRDVARCNADSRRWRFWP